MNIGYTSCKGILPDMIFRYVERIALFMIMFTGICFAAAFPAFPMAIRISAICSDGITPEAADEKVEYITISAAGDCTIGYDVDRGYVRSYNAFVDIYGLEYPFKNVAELFKSDDITVVNLETTFTDEEKKSQKEFRFKGKPEYARILKLSSIEAVNLANNHTHDYLEKGFEDTIKNLKSQDIGFFGEKYNYIKEVRGQKVGFLGYKCWYDSKTIREAIKNDIHDLKKDCSIVVVSFHWGIEREYYPNKVQTDLGRFAIDEGADLIIGHHPHVIQGIEIYKGRHIVYSLGNFSYGGHRNPADKDTFIFREKFCVKGRDVKVSETTVIPCSISSVREYNNYQPTPLYGDDGERVLKRLKEYSSSLKYGYDFDDRFNKDIK